MRSSSIFVLSLLFFISFICQRGNAQCNNAPVVTISYDPILCVGGTTNVFVEAFGGTEPYTGTGIFEEYAGTHLYYVVDANGCQGNVISTFDSFNDWQQVSSEYSSLVLENFDFLPEYQALGQSVSNTVGETVWTATALGGESDLLFSGYGDLSTNSALSDLSISFSDPVYGFGGNFFNSNGDGYFIPGVIEISLSNGILISDTVSSLNQWLGYYSNSSPILSIVIRAQDQNFAEGIVYWPTIDNLYLAFGTEISVPSVTIADGEIEQLNYFADTDGDGFGSLSSQQFCMPDEGYVMNNLDCDDGNPAIAPNAQEICNGIDDNCNLEIDEYLSGEDPNEFPNNFWKIYAFNGSDFNEFRGFADLGVLLDVSTENYFSQDGSPSEILDFQGCNVDWDFHSYKIRRQGFSTGNYNFVLNNWDDDVFIEVDGNELFGTSCCGSIFGSQIIYNLSLNENSTIEVKVKEYSGASQVDFLLEETINGCTDSDACNYNPMANYNNGTCEFTTVYYPDFDNDGFGTVDTSLSIIGECENTPAGYTQISGDCNDFNWNINPQNENCNYGCVSSYACNFNPAANTDDGTCIMTSSTGFIGDYAVGNWEIYYSSEFPGSEIEFTEDTLKITSSNLDIGEIPSTYVNLLLEVSGIYSFDYSYLTQDDAAEYDLGVYSINGINVALTNYDVISESGTVSIFAYAGSTLGFGITQLDDCCGAAELVITSFSYPENCISGCTDITACNYSDIANFDDGTCNYSINQYFFDFDLDGFGNQDSSIFVCDFPPSGFVNNNLDCNDLDISIFPGAEEIGNNGIDENCDGQIDNFISENSKADFLMYPVPSADHLIIEVSDILKGNEYFVFDSTGRILIRGRIESSITNIGLFDIENGCYYIKINDSVHGFVVKK
jgi:hypothetical protein